jgi:hypothetical protein
MLAETYLKRFAESAIDRSAALPIAALACTEPGAKDHVRRDRRLS